MSVILRFIGGTLLAGIGVFQFTLLLASGEGSLFSLQESSFFSSLLNACLGWAVAFGRSPRPQLAGLLLLHVYFTRGLFLALGRGTNCGCLSGFEVSPWYSVGLSLTLIVLFASSWPRAGMAA